MRRIFNSFIRAYKYFKIGWNTREYDWGYLLDLEKMKLEDMLMYFEHSQIMDTAHIVRNIKLALKMIDIIQEKDSSYEVIPTEGSIDTWTYISRKNVNTKNAHRFISDTMIEYIDNDTVNLIVKDDLRIEKAWNIYNIIRKEWMREWWD